MNILLDTNVLCRSAQPTQAQYQVAVDATDALQLRGDDCYLVPQVLYEFWAVATRPPAVNGLDLTVAEATAELTRLKTLIPVLPDTPVVFPEWERLVTTHHVIGKNAHDARLVAAMVIHGLTHLLTFNTADFARYPGITTLDPLAIAPPVPPTP